MHRIHVTDMRTFKRCRRKWFYVNQGLVPRKTSPGPLWFGVGIHYCLEKYYHRNRLYTPADWWNEYVNKVSMPIDEDFQDKLEELTDLANHMLDGYFTYDGTHHDWDEVIGIEYELTAKIPGTIVTLVGTADLVVIRNGRVWAVDHKTASSFPNDRELELDDQMTAYLWLMQEGIFNPAGVVYNVLRKSIPGTPEILQSGQLSKRVIDTTPEVYINTVLNMGLTVADYQDVIDKLKGKEFFRREKVTRSRRQLQAFGEIIAPQLREMTSKNTAIYPHKINDCAWDCPYLDLCRCTDDKGDVNYTRNALYQVVGRRR